MLMEMDGFDIALVVVLVVQLRVLGVIRFVIAITVVSAIAVAVRVFIVMRIDLVRSGFMLKTSEIPICLCFMMNNWSFDNDIMMVNNWCFNDDVMLAMNDSFSGCMVVDNWLMMDNFPMDILMMDNLVSVLVVWVVVAMDIVAALVMGSFTVGQVIVVHGHVVVDGLFDTVMWGDDTFVIVKNDWCFVVDHWGHDCVVLLDNWVMATLHVVVIVDIRGGIARVAALIIRSV